MEAKVTHAYAARARPVARTVDPGFREGGCAVLISTSSPGAVAQLVARLVRNEKARGSNPLSSTTWERPDTFFVRSLPRY